MSDEYLNGWKLELEDPLKGRTLYPRKRGITMVIDKGLGIHGLQDLLNTAGEYIDFLKFTFGTSLLYPHQILKDKINLAHEMGVDVYPGGTLFEIAIIQNKLTEFLLRARQLGFTAIEISNGTIELSESKRNEAIYKAHSLGFKVLTEVGKKDRDNSLTLDEMKVQVRKDLEAGADKIIIEGRESGKNISIYDAEGSIDMKMVEGIIQGVDGDESIIIWEAPLKKQQLILIKEFGPNVNLGNIYVSEVLALEALRRGLRGDTFGYTLYNQSPTDLDIIVSNNDRENIVSA